MLAQAFADLKKKIVAGTSLDRNTASDTSSGTGSHGIPLQCTHLIVSFRLNIKC